MGKINENYSETDKVSQSLIRVCCFTIHFGQIQTGVLIASPFLSPPKRSPNLRICSWSGIPNIEGIQSYVSRVSPFQDA